MRFIKICVIVLFVLSSGAYGFSMYQNYKNNDDTLPEITSDSDVLEIPCNYTQLDLLQGMHAYDETDGDITSSILVGSRTRFIEPGTFQLTYVVFDAHRQSASYTRKVHLTDYVSPTYSLSQPLVYSEKEGNYQESLNRIGVSDMLDGDLKEVLTQVDSDVNYSKEGSYHMSMEVSNSMGDTSTLSIPVHIVNPDTHTLHIALSQGLVYINQNETINPMDYVTSALDASNNQLDTNTITVDSQVDTTTPGVYEVHYSITNESGAIGETWLTVVVREVNNG